MYTLLERGSEDNFYWCNSRIFEFERQVWAEGDIADADLLLLDGTQILPTIFIQRQGFLFLV